MEYLEYVLRGDAAILIRMYGVGDRVLVPSQIGHVPIRALADHVFAPDASVMFRPQEIRTAILDGDEFRPEPLPRDPDRGSREGIELPARSAGSIRSVFLPEGIEQIGNYAFYGLFNLEEISFPSTMRSIGSGLFSGCGKIRRMDFSMDSEREEEPSGCEMQFPQKKELSSFVTPGILREAVWSVPYELEAVLKEAGSGKERLRLLFPEYYEEPKENTPARIISIIYHGTGHPYRNCFLGREIQFERYDETFPLAKAQESRETCIRLAMNRLRSGLRLSEEAETRYVDYLRGDLEALFSGLLSREEFDLNAEMSVLDRHGFFTENTLGCMLDLAAKAGRADGVSFLMDLERKKKPVGGRRKFEF